MKVYGIPNCDTVKKALTWLKANGIAYEFHDYKKLGITAEKLQEWTAKTGWEPLVNKRGTTWKKLSPEQQAAVTNSSKAISLMQAQTSVIKRPVIEYHDSLLVGFDENTYRQTFGR